MQAARHPCAYLSLTVICYSALSPAVVQLTSAFSAGYGPGLALYRHQHWQFNIRKTMSQAQPAPLGLSSKGAEPELVARTLGHYSRRAEIFWEGTKDHDVSQNRNALIRNLEQKAPQMTHVLDLGCGPGRDVLAFREMGYTVTGLDGCPEFISMGKKLCSSASFLQQDLHELDLEEESYDGIFANAALFHVQRKELPNVMRKLAAALKWNGVLFTSNPRSMQGEDLENFGRSGDDQRYGHYQTYESWCSTLQQAGLSLVEHYYRPPGAPRDQQPWLATVSRKVLQ